MGVLLPVLLFLRRQESGTSDEEETLFSAVSWGSSGTTTKQRHRLISSCLFCPERELNLCELRLCHTHEALLFSDWGTASWCGWMFTRTTRSLLCNSVGSGERNRDRSGAKETGRGGGTSEKERGRMIRLRFYIYLYMTNTTKDLKPVLVQSLSPTSLILLNVVLTLWAVTWVLVFLSKWAIRTSCSSVLQYCWFTVTLKLILSQVVDDRDLFEADFMMDVRVRVRV